MVEDVVGFLRAEPPQVVVIFGPDGHTGHPDHIAVGALAEVAFDREAGGGDLFSGVA